MATPGMIIRIGGDISDAIAKINFLQQRITVFQNQVNRLNRLSLTPGLNESQQRRINNLLQQATTNLNSVTAAAAKSGGAFGSLGGLLGGFIRNIAGTLGPLAAVALAVKGVKSIIDILTPAFKESALKAQLFSDTLEKMKTTAESLKESLDFTRELESLKFRIQFGEGIPAQLNDLKLLEASTLKLLENNIKNKNVLADQRKEIDKTKPVFEEIETIAVSVSSSFSTSAKNISKVTPFGELKRAGLDVVNFSNITKENLEKLPEAQRKYILSVQELNNEEKRLSVENLNIQRDYALQRGQIGLTIANENKNAQEQAEKDYEEYLKELEARIDRERKLYTNLAISVNKGISGRAKFNIDRSIFPQIDVDVKNLSKINEQIGELKDQIKTLEGLKIPGLSTSKELNELREKLSLLEKIANATRTPGGNIEKEIAQSKKRQEAFREQLEEIEAKAQEAAEVVGNTLANAFSNVFDAIQSGQNVIKAFFSAIVQGVKSVIAELIKLALIKAITNLFAPGAGSFVGFGTRAHGGPVTGSTPYIVGERGPELFVPSTSGQIVPNNRLGGISGGAAQMISVMVTGRISGRDLVLSQAREGRYQGRNV